MDLDLSEVVDHFTTLLNPLSRYKALIVGGVTLVGGISDTIVGERLISPICLPLGRRLALSPAAWFFLILFEFRRRCWA